MTESPKIGLMEKDGVLRTLQEEFKTALKVSERNVIRQIQFPEAKGLIKVAIGMRRSGKTYFLFQTIRSLLAEGIPLERILYLNFEDDRILPMDHKEMGKLIDLWYTLHPENHRLGCFLFLDEVQNIENWALVLRRLADTKNVNIYVTGSSAKLLSKEIATSLRGRSFAIEVLPYSYSEFLSAHKLNIPQQSMGQQSLDEQKSYLNRYFQIGGFPGIQELPENERVEVLQQYVETVVFRDVVERYQVSNIALLKYLIHSLLKNTSSQFSITKFYKDLKSQGYKVGKDTLFTYLEYLEDAFLIFAVPVFTESLRKLQTSPKKIYSVDNGLITASTFNLSDNLREKLENQVYLDLRRQGKKIFYYHTSNGYEVDFITQDLQGKNEIIQVVWDSEDPSTAAREERALKQAEQELGFTGRLIDWKAYVSAQVACLY